MPVENIEDISILTVFDYASASGRSETSFDRERRGL